MKLALTTNRGFKILDTETGQAETRHDGARVYFGITWNERNTYVGCMRDNKACLLTFNAALEPVASTIVPDSFQSAPHSLLYSAILGKLFWTAPGLDAVLISSDMATFEKWYPSLETATEWAARMGCDVPMRSRKARHGVPIEDGKERKPKWTGVGSYNLHHFNSVFVDAQHIYVNAHNRGYSELSKFTHDRAFVSMRDSGKASHTCWAVDNAQWYVDSTGGKVMREDDVVYDAGRRMFPRGIAWDGTHYYLGMSTQAPREERDMSKNGFVRVLNEDWQHVRDIEIEGAGQIYEIRALCADARTHNGLRPPIE